MNIETRHIIDKVEIDENTKTIGVRTRMQKWVVTLEGEMLVQDNAGYHRVCLEPGNWAAADQYSVRNYADMLWTQEVIDAWVFIQSQNLTRRAS